jgi:DNA-binding winged helix-turn-helix (wHTH) protein
MRLALQNRGQLKKSQGCTPFCDDLLTQRPESRPFSTVHNTEATMIGQQQAARREIGHPAVRADWGMSHGEPANGADPSSVLRFRRFSILPEARVLLAGNSPVPIGSRAFDLLVVLAQARGTLVTKEAIIRQVWPSTIVEESNLRFQMACVRKALGRDRDLIKTIPGRGYLLAADVDESSAHPAPLDAARDVRPRGIARPPIWSDLVPGHIEDAGKPTIVLFGEDEPTRERVQALLRLAGLQVQLFGSVNAFLSDIRASA